MHIASRIGKFPKPFIMRILIELTPPSLIYGQPDKTFFYQSFDPFAD